MVLNHRLPRGVLAVAIAIALWAATASGQLLARVEPGWSPFVRATAPPEWTDVVAEARGLLASDPGRVAQVLADAVSTPASSHPLLTGLRADALYFAGGDTLFEAQRLYRAVVTATSEPEQVTWAHFMLGNIHKVLGFETEAEIEYRTARGGQPGPWAPAVAFDLAVLALETGRFSEAREGLSAWLRDHSAEPGRPLVLFLLGECEMALGDAASAKANFAQALQLEPEGWVPRPETGYALAELLRREGRPADAVSVLETLVAAVPGTTIAAKARLDVGGIWEAGNEVAQAARSYAQLLDDGAPSPQSREAILRLGLLGVDHADRMELTEPYPAYRVFYRPRPTLERYAAERDPLAAQRAMRGLARLARREGDVIGALATLARVFQEYPESPESGQAYESFMDLLENHLAERLEAGAYAEVVEVYQGLKGPMGWVPTRDTGSLAARAAEAYEALGAPASARRVYQGLLAAGTRAIGKDELTTRVERTRLRGGHLEALRRWVERAPDDRDARVALARALAREGETGEARQHFLAVARRAPNAEEKLRALAEADRLLPGSASVGELIAAMEARQELADSLPPGPERDAWKTQDRLIEARLRFASAEYEVAAELFRQIPELGPADTYLLALAESRAGRRSRAADVFADLAESPDPLFAGLAALHVELAELDRATGSLL